MSFIDCLAFSWSGPSIFLDSNRLDTSWIVASRAKTTQSYINHSVAKQFPFKSHVNRSIICGSLILQLIQFVRIQGAPFRFKKHFLFWKKNPIEGIIGQCPMAVRTFPLHNWMRQETTLCADEWNWPSTTVLKSNIWFDWCCSLVSNTITSVPLYWCVLPRLRGSRAFLLYAMKWAYYAGMPRYNGPKCSRLFYFLYSYWIKSK